jgi:hypothetical protein
MLPRIANLDREFVNAVQNYVRTHSRESQLLKEIRAHVIHEGHASAIRRSADELEHAKMTEAAAETTMAFAEIDNVDSDYVLAKANDISSQFQKHMSQHLFETINEVTEKTGLRADAKGQGLTNDLLIELFSKMQMNFERSQHGDVTIVASPQMIPTFQKLERQMQEDPQMKKKWDDMIERKRNEFREREINRNLVG